MTVFVPSKRERGVSFVNERNDQGIQFVNKNLQNERGMYFVQLDMNPFSFQEVRMILI